MRRTFWPCLVAATVLLAGCSGKPAPKEPDTTSTPSPTATPPPLPEAATHETAEGAASFVDHYLDVLNYAAHTGDTDALERISHNECSGCRDYADHYAERTEAGESLEGGEFSAGNIALSQYGTDTALVTDLLIAGGTVKDSSGSTTRSFDPSTEPVTFVARFSDGAWTMTQFVPGSLP